jgi:succinyl-CoA:acetate CoA-transferase
LRPLDIINSAEVIRRMGVIAMNTAIEVDILGQANSSHISGVNIVGGIGGAYDYSRNARISIFLTASTAQRGEISSIVPMVSHVDHTEHDVDVLITEQGIADLRGLEPRERASSIIESCAHPDYRPPLRRYLEEAKKKGGRQPLLMEQAYCFHLKYAKQKSMRDAI